MSVCRDIVGCPTMSLEIVSQSNNFCWTFTWMNDLWMTRIDILTVNKFYQTNCDYFGELVQIFCRCHFYPSVAKTHRCLVLSLSSHIIRYLLAYMRIITLRLNVIFNGEYIVCGFFCKHYSLQWFKLMYIFASYPFHFFISKRYTRSLHLEQSRRLSSFLRSKEYLFSA